MLAFTHLHTDLLFTVRSEVISNSVLSYEKQTKHLDVQKHSDFVGNSTQTMFVYTLICKTREMIRCQKIFSFTVDASTVTFHMLTSSEKI